MSFLLLILDEFISPYTALGYYTSSSNNVESNLILTFNLNFPALLIKIKFIQKTTLIHINIYLCEV